MLIFLQVSVTSTWYSSIALVNHNGASSRFGSTARDEEDDWRSVVAQDLRADFDTDCDFYKSVFLYLGLNRHGAHHVFPRLDFSKHVIAQRVIEKVCAELASRPDQELPHGLPRLSGDFRRSPAHSRSIEKNEHASFAQSNRGRSWS